MSKRFRGYLPVVIDIETGGFNAKKDAILELAAVTTRLDIDGNIHPCETIHYHIQPFKGANIEKKALDFTGIDPYHPFRKAISEQEALDALFSIIRKAIKASQCTRAILVGHNAFFDLSFINAAVDRNKIKRNPFHNFSNFDTVTLAGMAYGQTVLAKAIEAAQIEWDNEFAHTALYDAEKTSELFCKIMNHWHFMNNCSKENDHP